MTTRSSPPQHLLLIRLGALGDLMHLLPTIEALHHHWAHTQIHLLTSPLYVDFLAASDLPATLWPFQKGKHGWDTVNRIRQIAQQFRHTGIDTILNLHPSLNMRWLALQTLGWSRYQTHHHIYRKQKLSVTGHSERSQSRRHAIEDFYHVAQQAFHLPQLTEVERIPHLMCLPFSNNTATQDTPIIGLIPGVGGKRPNRAWPIERFVELVQQVTLTHPHLHWSLIGGPEEEALAHTLEATLRQNHPDLRLTNHCNQLTLEQTAQHLRGCNVVIGGDTGPLHVAAAVECQVIGLYAPTSVKRTGPVGLPHKITTLTPPESLSCWPCEKPVCRSSENSEAYTPCTSHISCDAVAKALIERL